MSDLSNIYPCGRIGRRELFKSAAGFMGCFMGGALGTMWAEDGHIPDVRIERPTDALVEIHSANAAPPACICTETDMESGPVLGHENLGVVIEVGSAVDRGKGLGFCPPSNTGCGFCRNGGVSGDDRGARKVIPRPCLGFEAKGVAAICSASMVEHQSLKTLTRGSHLVLTCPRLRLRCSYISGTTCEGEGSHGGALEQTPQRQLDAKHLPHLGHHPSGEE